jgi:hypothetical protein
MHDFNETYSNCNKEYIIFNYKFVKDNKKKKKFLVKGYKYYFIQKNPLTITS